MLTYRGRPVPWLVLLVALLPAPHASGAGGQPEGEIAGADDRSIFRLRGVGDDVVILEWDRHEVREVTAAGIRTRVPSVTLQTGLAVELEIEPFSIVTPDTRFVLGSKDGPDRPLEFDPASVSLFRGDVVGYPGSHVFLALSEKGSTGYIDLGSTRYRIGSASDDGKALSSRHVSVFETGPPPAIPPDVPFCGVEPDNVAVPVSPAFSGSTVPLRGLKHLELAVETDHEFFVLFEDGNDAMAYLTAMYGEVSDLYMRDVDTRVELVFARLWDNPDDLFNDVDPSPLPEFRNYWNANMGSVQRDVAQLLSGRRDYPFGGQAYLSELCTSSAYSVVGYAMGFFPDPSMPSPYSYDISVTSHEIGHNCGTGHTHDSPNNIDTCDDPGTTPQRGTIMSYCGQTWSGGNANRDLYFHSTIQSNMDDYIASVACVVDDCNQNGVEDSADIAGAGSADANSNGIPDECEDCNGNMVLDDTDIAMGSADVNGNGVPDECEPDCNGNVVPDSKDIADGTSDDLYGDDVPDECEADCDVSGVSDYTEIQADMTLDIDRNRILDACQDCDTDGTTDFEELAGAHHAWVTSGLASSSVREFHPITGVLTVTSSGGAGALADEAFDVIVSPGGNVLVTSHADHRVLEFDPSGSYLGDLVSGGAGGLTGPTGLTVTPDGATVLVASEGTNGVLAYDVATGTFSGEFVTPGAGGLSGPFGLIFGPNGNLFVTSDTNEVLEYDGQNGAFVRAFVDAAANGGLDQPRGIAFKPDGNLLVASFGTDEVLEYERQTGAPLGKWAQSGTATRLTQVSPWGVRVGPNGNVFVVRTGEDYGSGAGGAHHHDDEHDDDLVGHHGGDDHSGLHLTNAQIYEFDAKNGNFLRAYVSGNDHGLLFPTGFDFAPRWDLDCNFSQLPDACDIALGFSEDLDLNGTPDECEIDCNSNGIMDRLDIIPYGVQLDCNYNLLPDGCDVSSGTSIDCTANGIPDECETDCNLNGIADSCDIDAGTSTDCDGDGIPDDCEITDDFETNTGWTTGAPGDDAISGIWTRVDPVGTDAQPEDDHTINGRFCFVTGQGFVGGDVGQADVDGGTTTLISPTYDLSSDPDVEISYWRWYSNDTGGSPNADTFVIDISDDGGQSWTNVETVGPVNQASGGWFQHRFRVADVVTPTNAVVLRFVASDLGLESVVEAAVDDLAIMTTCCLTPPEVAGVVVEDAGLPRLSWDDQGGGVVYDVVSGSLSALRAARNVEDATCQVNDHGSSTWDDPRPDPALDEGYYYLVRAEECAAGTYGELAPGVPRQPLADCP